MALENVAHRLVAERQAQVGQGADNPVIAPGAMLLGHTHDQSLQLRVDPRATRSLTLRGAVTLLGHELAVPSEDGIGLDEARHFREGSLAQPLTEFSQRPAFAVCQPYAARDLVA